MFKSRKLVSLWLFICCFLVLAMIILGGYTRLTDSGLSITEWSPVTGFIPPLGAEDWDEKMRLYSMSPEFIKKNFSISMEEFKQIFLIEYIHRLLGRVVGIFFFIPLVYFWHKSYFLKTEKKALIVVSILGMAQGFFGWYMVKSGLIEDPQVNHYRLTLHMMTAVIIYGILAWQFLSSVCKPNKIKKPSAITWLSVLLLTLCLLQIGLGAMVSGLKAGYIYNSFPLMNGELIPNEVKESILTGNFLNDPVTIQFLHRLFGAILFIATLFFTNKLKISRITNTLAASQLLIISVFIQFCLGVITLVKNIPLNIALLHQFSAIAVFSILLFISHRLIYCNIPAHKKTT